MGSENKNTSKVFIIARHFLLRLGIKSIINVIGVEPEIKEFSSWEDLKGLEIDKQCAFVVIDGALLIESGQEAYDTLACYLPKSKILVVGNDVPKLPNYNGIISPSDGQQEVLDKFQKFFFEVPEKENTKKESSVLSERELDVLKEVSMGYSNKEIAERLFISINTVITHRKNITEKLEIRTIAGLTVYAIMNKLIHPEDSRK